jgi:DNA-binding transcriptional LysR family regulator
MSLTKAAEALCITQPAVTNQLRAFEEELGLKFFVRKPGGILLTEEGKILYEYAKRFFDLETEIERVTNDLKGLRAGTVSLGALRMYSPTFLHLLINHFHRLYPNIMVKVSEAGSLDLIESLLDFRNEVVICIRVEENPNVCFIPFCQEELVVVLPVGHRLAGKREISIRAVADERVILRRKGSASRFLVTQLFQRSKISPQILTEADNTELIKNMILREEGISFLARIAVSNEVEEGRLAAVPLEGNPIPLIIHIAYLKNHLLSPSAEVLLNVLQELVPRGKPVGSVTSLIAGLLAESRAEATKALPRTQHLGGGSDRGK